MIVLRRSAISVGRGMSSRSILFQGLFLFGELRLTLLNHLLVALDSREEISNLEKFWIAFIHTLMSHLRIFLLAD
jgi:hypothetical protein